MKYEIILLLVLSSLVSSRNNDDDESRPYEFGFTIEGEQHRRESKDVNGIIMGEFGFITADGIYHVTVYATDENGAFKILSMRNVRVSGPLDQPNSGKTHEKLVAAPTTTTPRPTTIQSVGPFKFTTIPSLNVPACGGCKLPSTTPRVIGHPKDNRLNFQTPAFKKEKEEIIPKPPGNLVAPEIDFDIRNNKKLKSFDELEDFEENGRSRDDPGIRDGKKYEQFEDREEIIDAHRNKFKNIPDTPEQVHEYSPKLRNEVVTFKPISEITVSNKQINIPGKDPIPIKDRYPNMQDGLPAGINENDMLDLLYKFNYTLGFHGHHEKGLKNGAKIGAYFVNGRDGISRVVEYIADENGYRPKVKFINLGYDHPDTPKEDTEKTFGLRGYEFTWFNV